MKIKCVKAECPVCHQLGLAQVFLRKDGNISYARTRHYSHRDKDSHKPQFSYCKIDGLNALKTLLNFQGISLSNDWAEDGQPGQRQTDKNHDIENTYSSLNQTKACGRSLAWF